MNTVPQKPPKILLWEAVSMAAEMILALLMARDEELFQDPDRLTTDIDQLITVATHLALRGDSLRDRLISDDFEQLLNSGVIEALAFKGFIAEVKRFLKEQLKLKQQTTDGELTHALRHSTAEELKATLANVLNWLEENRQKDCDYADYLAYLEGRRPSRTGGTECEDKDLPL